MNSLRKWLIRWHIFCIITNIIGMIIGFIFNNVLLILWGAGFAYYSAYQLDKLWEDK